MPMLYFLWKLGYPATVLCKQQKRGQCPFKTDSLPLPLPFQLYFGIQYFQWEKIKISFGYRLSRLCLGGNQETHCSSHKFCMCNSLWISLLCLFLTKINVYKWISNMLSLLWCYFQEDHLINLYHQEIARDK